MKNDIYPQIFADEFKFLKDRGRTATRSSKILLPMHSAIARQIESHGFTTNSIGSGSGKEELIVGGYGRKRVDIAIHAPGLEKPKGVVLFKGIRSNYNKNANNLIEILRGESCMLLDMQIPVYQIIFIPTRVRRDDRFEEPTARSQMHYENFVEFCKKSAYWGGLKIGVYYIDVDYCNCVGKYSDERKIKTVEEMLSEGIDNFCEGVA